MKTRTWFVNASRSFLEALTIAAACLVFTAGLTYSVTALPGCSTVQDPVDLNAVRYYQSQALYTSTVRTMTSLSASNTVSLQQMEDFEVARSSASRLLGEWRQAIADRRPFSSWDSLESLLEEMARIQIVNTPAP